MIGIVLALVVCLTPAPAQTGLAYHYHPYPDPAGRSMRQVAARRGMVLLPQVEGYVAVRDCRRVDTAADPTLRRRPWQVWARIGGHVGWWQVVDCSAPADYAHQDRLQDVIEVDYWTAHQDGWSAYGGDAGPGRVPAAVYRYRRD